MEKDVQIAELKIELFQAQSQLLQYMLRDAHQELGAAQARMAVSESALITEASDTNLDATIIEPLDPAAVTDADEGSRANEGDAQQSQDAALGSHMFGSPGPAGSVAS